MRARLYSFREKPFTILKQLAACERGHAQVYKTVIIQSDGKIEKRWKKAVGSCWEILTIRRVLGGARLEIRAHATRNSRGRVFEHAAKWELLVRENISRQISRFARFRHRRRHRRRRCTASRSPA